MTYTAELRGIFFRQPEEREYASTLSIGSPLSLEREPENPHDPYAIKVLARFEEGETETVYHIGYIAREVAAWIAPDMDDGVKFSCVVSDFITKGRSTYPMLTIESPEE